MMKGGLPPFKKLDKDVIQISKTRKFQPNLLISNLLQKKDYDIKKKDDIDDEYSDD